MLSAAALPVLVTAMLDLEKLSFSYGELSPTFSPTTYQYKLSVPKCDHSNWDFKLLPLNVRAEGGLGVDVRIQIGDLDDTERRANVAVLSDRSGIQAHTFERGLMTVTLTAADEALKQTPVVYSVNIVGDLQVEETRSSSCPQLCFEKSRCTFFDSSPAISFGGG